MLTNFKELRSKTKFNLETNVRKEMRDTLFNDLKEHYVALYIQI